MKAETKRKIPVITVIIIAVIIVAAVVVAFAVHNDSDMDYESGEQDDGTVMINGEKYEERPNLEKYLIFGVDEYADDESDLPGQCDVIMLMVIDKTENTVGVIEIDRNTKAKVFTYDENGRILADAEVQIAYAHAHGYEDESAAESVADSVSDLLYGVDINKYAALDMDSIGVLNNIAGGVTVTIEDDFSKDDPTLVKGETIKLTDEQAEHYVRGRMNVGDGRNSSRMKRQHQFLEGMKTSFKEQYQKDPAFANNVYDRLKECMFTNMTAQDFSKIAKAEVKNEDLGTFTIEGTYEKDDSDIDILIPDESSINEAVTTLIYRKVE